MGSGGHDHLALADDSVGALEAAQLARHLRPGIFLGAVDHRLNALDERTAELMATRPRQMKGSGPTRRLGP
jgi:hypothetical protein